jgi:acetyltransferase-like isoleucine patch superfamily enzyme
MISPDADTVQPAVTPRREQRTWLRRLFTALREEVAALHPRLIAVDLIARLLPHLTFCRTRTALYRWGGIAIGPKTVLFGRLQLTGQGPIQRRLRIGSLCNVNAPVFVDLNADITIGDHVSLGHHTVFVTADHELGVAAHRGGPLSPKPIVIEDGCLIGACVTILPGVRIGRSSVVTPGSVVGGDVPPHKMVGGVPARIIKSLPPEP